MKNTRMIAVAIAALFTIGCSKSNDADELAAPSESIESVRENIEAEDELRAEELEQLEEEGKEEGAEEEKGASNTGVEACDHYLSAFEVYMRCLAVPSELRETTERLVEETVKTWAALLELGLEDEMASACAEAAEGIREATNAFGCAP